MIFSSLVPTLIKGYLKNIYLYTNKMKLNEGTLFYKNVNGWKHTVPVLFFIGTGAGAGGKTTRGRSWSRSKMDRLRNTVEQYVLVHCKGATICRSCPVAKPSSQPRLIYIYRFKYVSVIYVPVFASRVMDLHRYRYSAAYWIDIFAAVLRSRCRSEPAYFGCSWSR